MKHAPAILFLVIAAACGDSGPKTLAGHLRACDCTDKNTSCDIVYTADPEIGKESLMVIDPNSRLSYPEVLDEPGIREAVIDGVCQETCTAWLNSNGGIELRSSEGKPVVIGG